MTQSGELVAVSINSTSYKGSGTLVSYSILVELLIVSINSTSYKGSGLDLDCLDWTPSIEQFPLIPLPIKEAVSVVCAE